MQLVQDSMPTNCFFIKSQEEIRKRSRYARGSRKSLKNPGIAGRNQRARIFVIALVFTFIILDYAVTD